MRLALIDFHEHSSTHCRLTLESLRSLEPFDPTLRRREEHIEQVRRFEKLVNFHTRAKEWLEALPE